MSPPSSQEYSAPRRHVWQSSRIFYSGQGTGVLGAAKPARSSSNKVRRVVKSAPSDCFGKFPPAQETSPARQSNNAWSARPASLFRDFSAGGLDSQYLAGSLAPRGQSQSFETEMLAAQRNFAGLARINRNLIGRLEAIDSPPRVVLDMDSTEIPVYGEQEQSAYNGHYQSTCYDPRLMFNREVDCLAAKLRPGNVHGAEGWEELVLPEIERQ